MAGEFVLYFSNGQQLSAYTNTSVINAPLHVNMNGAATSTSPYDFSVRTLTDLRDITAITVATGEVEIYANGVRTGQRIPTDQRWLITQTNRKKWVPRLTFRPGVKYQLVVTIQTT